MEKQRTGQTSFQADKSTSQVAEKTIKRQMSFGSLKLRKPKKRRKFLPAWRICIFFFYFFERGLVTEHSLSMRGNQSEGPADRDNNFD